MRCRAARIPIDADQAVLDFAPLEEIRTSDGRSLSGLLVAGVEEMIVVLGSTLSSPLGAAHGGRPHIIRGPARHRPNSRVGHERPARGRGGHRADLTIIVHENGIPRFSCASCSRVTDALVNELGMSLIDAELTKREVGLAEERPDGPEIRTMSRGCLGHRGDPDPWTTTSATSTNAVCRGGAGCTVSRSGCRSPARAGGGRIDDVPADRLSRQPNCTSLTRSRPYRRAPPCGA